MCCVFLRQLQILSFTEKVVHNLRHQAVAVCTSGGLLIRINTSCHSPELFGKGFLVYIKIQSNSHNSKLNAAALKICHGLCEDSANLAIILIKVIHPLNSKFNAAHFLHSLVYGCRCRSGDQKASLQGLIWFQNHTEINPASLR